MNIEAKVSPLRVRGNTKLSDLEIRELLIRGTNWIGDAVMTLPAMASIRKTFPKARITMLAKPWVADVYRLCPHIDEILIFESPGRHDGVTGKFRLAADLRTKRFDAAILLQNAIEAAIVASLAGIPIRGGFSTDGRGWLLTHAVRRSAEIRMIHQTHYYLEMVKALGCTSVDSDFHLAPTPEDKSRAEDILKRYNIDNNLLIGMAPGATYGAAKKWFPERFAAVADRLSEKYGASVLLFGSPADQDSTGIIRRKAQRSILDLAGKTNLSEAMAVMARCRLFISNDSGLMHVAAALDIPTVAIFGSTNPVTTGPVGAKSIVIRKDVPCSPCLKTTCPTDFRCMELIIVDDILDAAQGIMEA
ncbi:MAG: lipopolysaccharide heptosyltransferase II [Syntrophales bacterium]|nr:lipopolysaccharide heptosyltransferase II [Syntrophales bacterium]